MTAASRFLKPGLVLLVLAGFAGCSGDEAGPEDRVRAWLESVETAAEAKERGEVMAHISERYADARDNSRDDVENMLRVYFLRSHKVALITTVDDIVIMGDTAAKVELTVGMAGTNDSALGISADAYHFELELEADGDDWELISARWGELGEELH